MVSQVGLEAEGLNNRQQRFDEVYRCAWPEHVLRHMAPSLAQDIVDGADAVCIAGPSSAPPQSRHKEVLQTKTPTDLSKDTSSSQLCAECVQSVCSPSVSKCKGGRTSGSLNLNIIHGLHQSRRRHEEGRVADTTGSGDELSPAPRHRLLSDLGIHDLVFDVANGLIAQWSLPRAPLEALQRHSSRCALIPPTWPMAPALATLWCPI